jgi:Tol biopolymer transport system component
MRRTRRLGRLALLATAVSVMAAGSSTALAVVPAFGTTPAATTTTINQSNGPQRDPHVSGSLVTYTDEAPVPSRIHVFDLGAGVDMTIAGTSVEHDFLSDVSGTSVVFTRIFSARAAIMRYDTASGTVSELDPQAASDRTGGAIGGGTVAWMDMAFAGTSGQPEIVAYDLAGGSSTRLTNDAFWDSDTAVSPGGDVIAWTKCTGPQFTSGCDVYKAVRSGSTWTASGIALSGEESQPDTDGSVIVYGSDRAGELDVYWQPVPGGSEQQVTLAGRQRNPNVSNGLVSFEHEDPAAPILNWDVALYEVATNTLYRLTTTSENEYLNDVDYDPATRRVRVVFTRTNNGTGDDIYAMTFTLPARPSYAFTGFFSPVDNLPTLNLVNAGRAIPVKFSLGGDQGLDIFEAGYPRSQQIACDSTAAVDGVEETLTAGGSSLSYDAASDVYTYVWTTDKAWAGTCRQFVLGLADGSVHRASFKFK